MCLQETYLLSSARVLNWWTISLRQVCWKALKTRKTTYNKICKRKSIIVNITLLSGIKYTLILSYSVKINLPYILESNLHQFYSCRELKGEMQIRIECGLDLWSRAGVWPNDRASVRVVRTIQGGKSEVWIRFENIRYILKWKQRFVIVEVAMKVPYPSPCYIWIHSDTVDTSTTLVNSQ
jgi:hypothetical protein